MDAACDRVINPRDHGFDHVYSPPVMSGEKRIVNETDFFADPNNSCSIKSLTFDVKSESSYNNGLEPDTGLNLLTPNTTETDKSTAHGGPFNIKQKRSLNKLVQFADLQAELNRMNKENQRLKSMLNQVNNNYHALQQHIATLLNQRPRIPKDTAPEENEQIDGSWNGGVVTARQFMDLGETGPTKTSSEGGKEQDNRNGFLSDDHQINLRCDSNKTTPSPSPRFDNSKDFDHNKEAMMRKARVSVRTRSEAAMISDGCQWRKYGQKMAKGNPCPRAYYRCTMAGGCPVRKQVQRCAEDKGILITTYEGNHNHPLPPAAMAMMSATSAAASTLLSGSMPSGDGLMINPRMNINLPNFSQNFAASISASSPFPTVTLDLTNNPNTSQFQSPRGQFHNPFPNSGFGPEMLDESKFSGLQSDMVSAAAAAITADPNMKAALIAAITSIMGNVDDRDMIKDRNL